ncbi:MAG: class I SAM-dependent methyltransferase [Lachnospiraceae bacterium]|nr:class I SAM-dependent methyltransferase [Lachnospiraceae bacterium]
MAEQSLKIIIEDGEMQEEALAFSRKENIPIIAAEAQKEEDLVLIFAKAGIRLSGAGQHMKGDLSKMLPRLKPNNLMGEMLVKATKRKGVLCPLRVLDATAGLGEDSLLLAAAGHEVRMVERDPVIALLLQDALRRARQEEALQEIAGRMQVCEGDSIQILHAIANHQEEWKPDMIYLDPMFPGRNKSGLVKKKFQMIHQLEDPCAEEEKLLTAAIEARPERIIIKRPAKGPFLAGRKPSYSISGKTVRYDCLVL